MYEWAEVGGLQGALSRAARRKHKTRARPPASSQMAPSGFCPRPSWDGSVSQDRAWASGTGAGPRGHHSSPRPRAISPLCPCSGLRAWHPLQRRVRPVCAVHPGDLPGRGRPAQLRTVPQRRRARPGRCPQRLGVRRQVWAPPGGEAGAGTRCLWSPQGQSPAGLRGAPRPIPSWPRPPAAAHTEGAADTLVPGSEGAALMRVQFGEDFTVYAPAIAYGSTAACDRGTSCLVGDHTCCISWTTHRVEELCGVCRALGPELRNTGNFTVFPADSLKSPLSIYQAHCGLQELFHLLPHLTRLTAPPISLPSRAVVGTTQGNRWRKAHLRG